MARKGTYKMVTVVKEVKAPCEFSGRIYTYEKLSCGHYHVKPEVKETAKMIRAMFVTMSGEPQKRRCQQCVSGKPSIPAISPAWLSEQSEPAS